MTESDLKELEALREFKRLHEGSALNRAFNKLEIMLDSPSAGQSDGVMSVKAFKAVAEALILLKEELIK